MKKLALVFCAALALAGCNPQSGFPNLAAGVGTVIGAVANAKITQEQLDAARATYQAVFLVPAATYRRLPLCARDVRTSLRNQCAQRSVVLKIQQVTLTVRASFDRMQSLVDQGASGEGVQTAWTALQTAIGTAQGVAAAFSSST